MASARRGGNAAITQSLASGAAKPSRGEFGRANRGSQRQLQDYVNERQDVLNQALLTCFPARLQESTTEIRWVSPLARNDYEEYRDDDFLESLGLGEFKRDLASFWPTLGPSWDGLAILSTSLPTSSPVVILVEAKSHVPEIYGNGCQAGATSRDLIEKSLGAAKRWCGAQDDADWMGALYQSANRLAHLYFIRECLRQSAWLVNLYFTDDPYRPTSLDNWHHEVETVKKALGLTKQVPGAIDLFLPALELVEPSEPVALALTKSKTAGDLGNESSVCADGADDSSLQMAEKPAEMDLGSFARWRDRWTILAEYRSAMIPDEQWRIEQLASLWKEPIPGIWQRGIDPQLMNDCYRRGDAHKPHAGEHSIEHDILLGSLGRVLCIGNRIIDGVNAFPLSRDTGGGGRHGNVEADMLLLGEHNGSFRMFLCEVKDNANDPWYAVVESLRQLRLFLSNSESRNVFARRGLVSGLPAEIPVTGLVLAPMNYYRSRGKKQNAVRPAMNLLERFSSDFGVDLRLGVWDAKRRTIEELKGT